MTDGAFQAGGAFRAPELAAAEEAQRLRERATADERELAFLVQRRAELEREVARALRVSSDPPSLMLKALELFGGFVAGFFGAVLLSALLFSVLARVF